jgi:hypothetical protein
VRGAVDEEQHLVDAGVAALLSTLAGAAAVLFSVLGDACSDARGHNFVLIARGYGRASELPWSRTLA